MVGGRRDRGLQQAGTSCFHFEPREHAVYRVDARSSSSRKVVDIGPEPGRIFMPTGIDVAPDGSFAVVDRTAAGPRVQTFDATGALETAFVPEVASIPLIPVSSPTLGAGAVDLTGASLLVNHPEGGSLVTEYTLTGERIRDFGELRTVTAGDEAMRAALNRGLPLVDPTGGYYFVFVSGDLAFQKYNDEGPRR